MYDSNTVVQCLCNTACEYKWHHLDLDAKRLKIQKSAVTVKRKKSWFSKCFYGCLSGCRAELVFDHKGCFLSLSSSLRRARLQTFVPSYFFNSKAHWWIIYSCGGQILAKLAIYCCKLSNFQIFKLSRSLNFWNNTCPGYTRPPIDFL